MQTIHNIRMIKKVTKQNIFNYIINGIKGDQYTFLKVQKLPTCAVM